MGDRARFPLKFRPKVLITASIVVADTNKNAAKAYGSVFLLSPSTTRVGTSRHSARRQAGGISCYSAIGSSSTNSRHPRNSRLFLFRGSTRGVLFSTTPAYGHPFYIEGELYLSPVPRAPSTSSGAAVVEPVEITAIVETQNFASLHIMSSLDLQIANSC